MSYASAGTDPNGERPPATALEREATVPVTEADFERIGWPVPQTPSEALDARAAWLAGEVWTGGALAPVTPGTTGSTDHTTAEGNPT